MSKKIQNTIEEIKLSDSEKEQLLENIWNNKDVHSEKNNMRMMNKFMKTAAAVAVIGALGVGSVSAYEYVKELMSAEEVVSIVKADNELTEKFGKSPQDVMVKENNGYKITYLGRVTSDEVKDPTFIEDFGDIMDGSTTLVLAIQPAEGAKTSIEGKDFSFIPMIKGVLPLMYPQCLEANSDIIDGVLYNVITVPGVWDIFGYDKVYLGVNENFDFAGYYMANDGEIKIKEKKNTLNVLFEIKTDKSKADKEKAKEYLSDYYYGDRDPNAIEDEPFPGEVKGTEEDFKTAIANSTLLSEDEELYVDILGRPIFGIPEKTQWIARKNYMQKTGKIDYEWHYDRDERVLYIFAVELRDGKYYQNAYKYNGNARQDFAWVEDYCSLFGD